MGYEIKSGLDYYPLDVDMFEDPKILLLEEKHSYLGGYVAIGLLSYIYREGYYVEYDSNFPIIFAKRLGNGITSEAIVSILDTMRKTGFIDNELFEKEGVITSKSIQERWMYITSKLRRKSKIQKHNLLGEPNNCHPPDKTENCTIPPQNCTDIEKNVTFTPKNVTKSETKESKVINMNINNNIPKEKFLSALEEDNLKTKKVKTEDSKDSENETKIKKNKKFKEYTKDAWLFAEWFETLLPPERVVTDKDWCLWADTYHKLITIDKMTKPEIAKVCKWAREDDFWSENFLSAVKLRKKSRNGITYYQEFLIRMNKQKNVQNNKQSNLPENVNLTEEFKEVYENRIKRQQQLDTYIGK